MLADLTKQSERVLGMLREVTSEFEQSLQKVEASLENVDQALVVGRVERRAVGEEVAHLEPGSLGLARRASRFADRTTLERETVGP